MASLKRKAGAELAAAAAGTKKAKQQQSSLMSFFAGPRGGADGAAKASGPLAPTTTTTAMAAPPRPAEPVFNKAKWVATLTEEQRQLLRLEIDTLGESWLALLRDDLTTTSFLDLKRFLSREHGAGKKIFPPPEDVYSWSRYTPVHEVKVVIVGQDPYHNHGQAHGLAFSVKPPVPPPPSLRNVYVGLRNDYPATFQTPPTQNGAGGGLLTAWAERGVLLLNTCLTVRAHEANSHANHGWERFTQRVIDLVAQRRTHGVVFVAWGSPAAKRVARIDSKRHLVLRSVHPSPLSAHRGFFDCGHFRKANEWLVQRYGPAGEIDWSLVPGTSTLEGVPAVPAAPASPVAAAATATATATATSTATATAAAKEDKAASKQEEPEEKGTAKDDAAKDTDTTTKTTDTTNETTGTTSDTTEKITEAIKETAQAANIGEAKDSKADVKTVVQEEDKENAAVASAGKDADAATESEAATAAAS